MAANIDLQFSDVQFWSFCGGPYEPTLLRVKGVVIPGHHLTSFPTDIIKELMSKLWLF